MPEQKKLSNVLWLVSWYPHDENVSLGDFIQRQAQAANPFCNITVAGIFPKKGISAVHIESKIRNEQLRELIIYYPDRGEGWKRSIIRYYYILKAAVHLYRKELKTLNPEVIHLHVLYPMAVIAWIYSYLLHIPLVISEHSSYYLKTTTAGYNGFRRISERFVVKKSEAVIVVSEVLQKAMTAHGLIGKYYILPNIVDDVFFIPPAKTNKSHTTFQWVHTSTLAEGIKDIEGILTAVQALIQIRQDFLITFIGGSHTRCQKYASLAADLGISSFVVFFPEKSQTDMAVMLQRADAFVNFSKMETFGLSVIEALAAGLPCIATHTGIFDQWIDQKSGILVDSGNISQLVDAMRTIMDRYESFDITATRSQMKMYYAADRIGRQLVALYDTCIVNKAES